MSYEYKYQSRLEDIVDDNVTEVDEQIFILDEIGYVYAQAAKADEYKDELQTINGILLGEVDTLKINLNHYKKQATEYEAKAKVLDRVKDFAEEPPFLLANNENEDYERYAYDQILKLINKYESGDHNV